MPGKEQSSNAAAVDLGPLTVVGSPLPDTNNNNNQRQLRSIPPAQSPSVVTCLDAGSGAIARPVELLHRRKIYVEGPRQLVGSSSSELSADTNCRSKERPSGSGGGVVNCSRQISPASCNSESVASTVGACGLCGLMPHCAILEGSAKARKIRGGNTVIVEEQDLDSVGAAAAAAALPPPQGAKNRMSKFNSSSMDRSVDSIGSCSLDVDADSTDFSGTIAGSGSSRGKLCSTTYVKTSEFCFGVPMIIIKLKYASVLL